MDAPFNTKNPEDQQIGNDNEKILFSTQVKQPNSRNQRQCTVIPIREYKQREEAKGQKQEKSPESVYVSKVISWLHSMIDWLVLRHAGQLRSNEKKKRPPEHPQKNLVRKEKWSALRDCYMSKDRDCMQSEYSDATSLSPFLKTVKSCYPPMVVKTSLEQETN